MYVFARCFYLIQLAVYSKSFTFHQFMSTLGLTFSWPIRSIYVYFQFNQRCCVCSCWVSALFKGRLSTAVFSDLWTALRGHAPKHALTSSLITLMAGYCWKALWHIPFFPLWHTHKTINTPRLSIHSNKTRKQNTTLWKYPVWFFTSSYSNTNFRLLQKCDW